MKTETIEEIKQKIREYQTGEDFHPLKIIFNVRPPVFLAHPWIHFDSLVMQACLRDCLGESFYSLPTDYVLDMANFRIPIKKTKDVYHASVSQFDNASLFQSTIFKRFNEYNTDKLHAQQRKGKIQTDKGHFKDFMIHLPFITPNRITFYTCADKKELERLIPFISHLGKKGAIGGGQVLNFTIEKTEADYSFYKDGKIMRPIPLHLRKGIPLIEGTRFMNIAYKPPYWDKSNVSMCLVPNSQISTGY